MLAQQSLVDADVLALEKDLDNLLEDELEFFEVERAVEEAGVVPELRGQEVDLFQLALLFLFVRGSKNIKLATNVESDVEEFLVEENVY